VNPSSIILNVASPVKHLSKVGGVELGVGVGVGLSPGNVVELKVILVP
jgi:hypothetical protein